MDYSYTKHGPFFFDTLFLRMQALRTLITLFQRESAISTYLDYLLVSHHVSILFHPFIFDPFKLYIYIIYRYPLWRNPGLVMLSVYILPDLCVSLGSIRDGERWRTFVSNVSMRTWRTQIALSPRGEVEFNGYHVLLFFFRKSDLAIEAPVIYMRKRCCFNRKESVTEEETSFPSKSDSLAGGSTPSRCYSPTTKNWAGGSWNVHHQNPWVSIVRSGHPWLGWLGIPPFSFGKPCGWSSDSAHQINPSVDPDGSYLFLSWYVMRITVYTCHVYTLFHYIWIYVVDDMHKNECNDTVEYTYVCYTSLIYI